jgi:hypothetical protein
VSKAWTGGSTSAWRKLRAFVLLRDGYRCRVRIKGVCIERATQAHHLDGVANGVVPSPDRVVAACAPCNLRVADPNKASAHQRVVAWARATEPATFKGMREKFPDISDDNLRLIVTRAVRRGELRPLRRGVYASGPTGVPPATIDPLPRPSTRW